MEVKKYAILSVSDKTGLSKFARALVDRNFLILSTGGTARYLEEEGIPLEAVSKFTGQPEILGGRVKTLHSRVHAGILARRNLNEDLREMSEQGFSMIDLVCVSLYPFVRNLESSSESSKSLEEMVELIDIGGPTMLRASAKNFESVYSIIDPNDYSEVIECLDLKDESKRIDFRRKLAAKVFARISSYDLAIAEYLSSSFDESGAGTTKYTGAVLELIQNLRYGENPHQKAGWYIPVSTSGSNSDMSIRQLQGKELSYNNINDFGAALDVILDLLALRPDKYSSVVIKHANPCGVAYGINQNESLERALASDPVSAFGGIIALSHVVESDVANLLSESFYEVILAPDYSDEAKMILSGKKNLRLLEVDYSVLSSQRKSTKIYKSVFSSFLVQSADVTESGSSGIFSEKTSTTQSKLFTDSNWVSGSGFHSLEEEDDAMLAWLAVKHVKSNAITIVSQGQLIGVGAGQMNRVDSVRLAIDRARRYGFKVEGSVLASDAFFPFPDSIKVLEQEKIGLVIQPGGSLKDREVISAAKEGGVRMLFTGTRHFRH
ncbi:MAG TPA: bifunctional phosphoribosylaminoimidazolecarboxamide formyltransferase/IMP cyclohydrolase [Oligoflexia bacterium]|nr:bifunctional phosphoribosylaminoimidazolecarboxamide formyltransferase/IMP cyclohydrolase [Oligoflexia bacterium]HMP47161.1 bifunctional phosphoribosylaminoimidazolecarboxamide formyltransferase/IMP cyclohydrolase [Oligoflexia bacterium]